jgi:hypothetical protein
LSRQDRPVQHVRQTQIQASHISTYRERGVAAPFTTPLLLGARVRSAGRATELLLPNPSGKRGVYVLSWSSTQQFCRPTVHDMLLRERIEALAQLTPTTMRRAARDIAALGHAGPAAKAAAIAADEADRGVLRETDFHLLITLMAQRQSNRRFPNEQVAATALAANPDLVRLGRQAVVDFAKSLALPAEQVTVALAALGATFAPIGLDQQNATCRVSALIGGIEHMRRMLTEWSTQAGERNSAAADTVARSAGFALDHIRPLVQTTRSLIGDMSGLLRAFIANRGTIQDLIERPLWVLDGWENIVRLWGIATQSGIQRSALPELARLTPLVPSEIASWIATAQTPPIQEAESRAEPMNEGWRIGGAAFGLVARNEQLRALTV